MRRSKDNRVLMHGLILVTILATAKSAEAEITMEAAFQGHCGHTSPCEQLCYEIHDGMYECDCIEGYELNKNGYSCQVINSTSNFDGHSKSDEDVLYQKGASFSAKLANGSERDNQLLLGYSPSSSSSMESGVQISAAMAAAASASGAEASASISAASSSIEDSDDDDDDGEDDEGNNFFNDNQKRNEEQAKVNLNDYYISSEDVYFTNGDDQELTNTSQDVPELKANSIEQTTSLDDIASRHIVLTATTNGPSEVLSNKKSIRIHLKSNSIPTTISTGIHNGRTVKSQLKNTHSIPKSLQSNYPQTKVAGYHTNGIEMDMPIIDGNSDLAKSQNTYQDQYPAQAGDLSKLKSILSKVNKSKNIKSYVRESGTNMAILDKLNISNVGRTVLTDEHICDLDCGMDGVCEHDGNTNRCLCPLGKSGKSCSEDIQIRTPKFSKHSWIAFPALRGAYKHVQIRIEFRPESFDGIILLSGERDDLTGDFMALLLNKGFVEFWFDCGSGVGSVRSRETILLNEWNSVVIFRHRWDAWLMLNHGTKVQGRSNGLFSRITFREPVFLGGTGNITGLTKRLPVNNGFIGCIRRFVANDHEYKFDAHPLGDVTKGFDIQDCVTDKCFKYPCQHGGKCLPSDQGAVCLCPIGFVGDLCEIRMDLQVPAFNGSSYLRYAPLGDSALIWLELKIILKAEHPDGLILFSGSARHGDFIALSLSAGFVEFMFDLGSGSAVVRSEFPLTIGQWHSIKVSRTARLAVLKIDTFTEVMTISSNGFWHLSLPENIFLGGVNHVDTLPMDLKSKAFFVGCIQKVDINGHSLSIISEALGGANIGNCPHACVARPCGPLADCIPQMESYECRCNTYNSQCHKTSEISMEELQLSMPKNKNKVKMKNSKHHRLSKSIKMNSHSKYASSKLHSTLLQHPSIHTTTVSALAERTIPSKRNPSFHGHKKMKMHKLSETDDIEDDIIYRDTRHFNKQQHDKNKEMLQSQKTSKVDLPSRKYRDNEKIHGKSEHYHKDINTFNFKLSRLPTHYESFQTNPEIDILTFDDNVDVEIGDVNQSSDKDIMQNEDYKNYEKDNDSSSQNLSNESERSMDFDWKYDEYGSDRGHAHDAMNEETKSEPFFVDETLFDSMNGAEDYHRKELEQDMKRILANGPEKSDNNKKGLNLVIDEYDYEKIDNPEDQTKVNIIKQNNDNSNSSMVEDFAMNFAEMSDDLLEPVQTVVKETATKVNLKKPVPTTITQTDWSLLKKMQLPADHHSQFVGVRKNFGACFAGEDSYFHYNDAETMSQVINYKIDLNLRIKTHSENGVILWTGRKGIANNYVESLSLGIENGYLHFRFDLGSGEVDIKYNMSRVSDGLWHRVRAIRDSQAGYLEIDGRKTMAQYSPGKLKQLVTDTGLYVGGMPNAIYFTRRKYNSGFVGCISEIVLGGELKLNFDSNTLGTAHNVETGLL